MSCELFRSVLLYYKKFELLNCKIFHFRNVFRFVDSKCYNINVLYYVELSLFDAVFCADGYMVLFSFAFYSPIYVWMAKSSYGSVGSVGSVYECVCAGAVLQNSAEEMERKKERIMLMSLQRRQRADEARARADAAAAARRAREEAALELKQARKEEQQRRREAILQQYKLKKAVEEAEREVTHTILPVTIISLFLPLFIAIVILLLIRIAPNYNKYVRAVVKR